VASEAGNLPGEEEDAPDPLQRLERVRRALESPPPRYALSPLAFASEEELQQLEVLVDVGAAWLADRAEVLLAILEDRRRRGEAR